MKTISFDSKDLPGDERLRKERWVDSLSSGYARLHADAALESPFEGTLSIVQLGLTSIGSITGTVRTISREAEDIAIENSDNVVLLFNSGQDRIRIEQKGKEIDCAAGGAALVEQCEPSIIRMSPHKPCGLIAIQAPRRYVLRANPDINNRFLAPTSTRALALVRAYADVLLDQTGAGGSMIQRIAAHHISDLIAAAVDPDSIDPEAHSHGLRISRLKAILHDLDRYFLEPSFSLTALARRLGVTPRYVQAVLAEAMTSFTDELTNRRLMRAYDMLVSPRYRHMNVTDIGHECGFSTVSHFHRMFRRRFNATPGDVRSKAAD